MSTRRRQTPGSGEQDMNDDRALDYLAPLVKVGKELLEEGRSEAEGLAQGKTALCTVHRNTLARLHDALILPPDLEAAVERRNR